MIMFVCFLVAVVCWFVMFVCWLVEKITINNLKKELNRYKYNETHKREMFKKVEDFFRTIDSCMGYQPNTDIGRIANIAFKHWLYVESLEEKLRRK